MLSNFTVKKIFENMYYPYKYDTQDFSLDTKWFERTENETKKYLEEFRNDIELHNLTSTQLYNFVQELCTNILCDPVLKKVATNDHLDFLASTLKYHLHFSKKNETKYLLLVTLPEVANISLLGYILGPTFANFAKVIILAPKELGCLISHIETLMNVIGFPKTVAILKNSESEFQLAQKTDNPNQLIYFDYLPFMVDTIQVLHTSAILPLSTPIIIFDNADLDSACHSIMHTTWKKQLLFNWSAKEVFVQENIYHEFVSKMEEYLAAIDGDFSTATSHDLDSSISVALKRGVKVLSSLHKDLFIGGSVIDEKSSRIPSVSIISFRKIDEGISLVNNNPQGLCVSIWTENIGLANYVARKLDVANIWINTYGIYSPDVEFTPRKRSGHGRFGATNTFRTNTFNKVYKKDNKTNAVLFSKGVSAAKEALQNWGAHPRYTRINRVRDAIEITIKKCEINVSQDWREVFFNYIANGEKRAFPSSDYNFTVLHSPRGVIVIDYDETYMVHLSDFIIPALIEGNTLITSVFSNESYAFLRKLQTNLPVGVINLMPFNTSCVHLVKNNPDVGGCFCPFLDYWISENATLDEIRYKVTYGKNIWSNIG